jgi:uncharacterized protein YndB with AHSA1/START domain
MEATGKALLTTPGERQIRVERVFKAPRERVFAAHTDPKLLAQWRRPGGPELETVVEALDARAGGRWQFVTRNTDDGSEQVFHGLFREVVAPERIVWTFESDEMPGNISVDTTTFEDLGDRTKVDSLTTFHTGAERDEMLESGLEKEMNEIYARLDELLAG